MVWIEFANPDSSVENPGSRRFQLQPRHNVLVDGARQSFGVRNPAIDIDCGVDCQCRGANDSGCVAVAVWVCTVLAVSDVSYGAAI